MYREGGHSAKLTTLTECVCVGGGGGVAKGGGGHSGTECLQEK